MQAVSEWGSRTARIAAAYRARASARPHPLCSDPWASYLVGEEGRILLAAGDAVAPEMELGIAVRTVWLDEAIRHGKASQVVVLGAGLDTRSARLARPGVRFFEVDHPKTQGYKRMALEATPGYPCDASVFVPCDFERDELAVALKAAGFRPESATIVIWEGVIPYLTEDAVRGTFRVLATLLAPHSRVYFDYVDHARGPDGVADFAGEAGEPFLFKTPDIAPLVCGEGFQKVESLRMTTAQQARTGKEAANAPFFARWYLAEATL